MLGISYFPLSSLIVKTYKRMLNGQSIDHVVSVMFAGVRVVAVRFKNCSRNMRAALAKLELHAGAINRSLEVSVYLLKSETRIYRQKNEKR
jgi:hypothetical protein